MRRVRGAGTTGKIGVTGRGLKHVWARHEIDEVPERLPERRSECQVERRRSGRIPVATVERSEVSLG